MLTKTKKKKNRKNFKTKNLEKKKKKCLEILRIGSFLRNLAWIHVVVSEKPELMDGHLHHDSSQFLRKKGF